MRISLILITALILAGCETNRNSPEDDLYRDLQIRSGTDTLTLSLTKKGQINYLHCKRHDSIMSTWPLRYPVYRFLKGDVNNDGYEDIAVGVIKPTSRDTVARKRLFLFQIKNRSIAPLWLGSSLGNLIEDFTLLQADSLTLVRSIEIEKSNRYLVAEYEWRGFGLWFRRYLYRELSLREAHTHLNE